GVTLIGTPRNFDQRSSSWSRYSWRCAARCLSGHPPDTANTRPISMGFTLIVAPCFAASATNRSWPKYVHGDIGIMKYSPSLLMRILLSGFGQPKLRVRPMPDLHAAHILNVVESFFATGTF